MKTILMIGLLCSSLLFVAVFPATGASEPETLYTLSYDYSRLVFDTGRSSFYLALPARQVVGRYDLETGAEESAIPLSFTPTDAAMTPDGRWLFVGETQMHPDGYPTDEPGRIAEIDLETFTLVREIDYPFSPRKLVARDDRVLVVGYPYFGYNEVRLFHAVTGETTESLVVAWLNPTLDVAQQSFFCYGLGNPFSPNVRSFILTDPLRFGDRWTTGEEMVSEVYPSPDGQLLVSGGSFYRGDAEDFAQDMTLIRTPETALRFNAVARFEPPNGRTLLIVGDGLAFLRRDTLEPFSLIPLGGETTLDAAYAGEQVYALVMQDLYTVRMVRLSNPALGIESNQTPQPAFAWNPENPTDRDDVQFDASGSTDDDPAFANLTYRWDFDSDGVFETSASPEPTATQRFRGMGVQNVTLEVRDRFGVAARVTNSFNVTAVSDSGESFGLHTPWRIPLSSTRLVFDPVRPILYAANQFNQSLVQMDLTTGQITRQWKLDAQACGLAVRPDGSRLYLGLTTNDLTFYDTRGNGWIADFDLVQGRKEHAFAVTIEPMDMVATDGGKLVVFGESNPEREIQLYDAVTGGQLSSLTFPPTSRLALHPAQTVIYAAPEESPSILQRFWLAPDNVALGGPTESLYESGGRVFLMPDGTQLVTRLGTLLTASLEQGAVNDMTLIRDLGLGSIVNVLPLPDRGLVGLIQWTGLPVNNIIFLRDDWETELVRMPVDAHFGEVARYGDHYYLAASSDTETWVESRRIPASTVEENSAPAVTLLSPAADAMILVGDVVELHAEASDEDGIVTSLRFMNGEEDLGEAVAPWNSLSWQPSQPGTNYISAVATDNLGATARTPAVTLIVNAPPIITLNDPSGGVTLESPANFILEAEASDPDGSVVEVEFFYRPYLGGPVSLGIVNTSPYRLEVADFVGIDVQIEAVARDNLGASARAIQLLRIIGPAGDDIRRPLLAEGTDITIRTNNVAATKQFEESLRLNISPTPERTLWWEWTAPGDGVLHCSTRGSSFNAQLILIHLMEYPTMDLLALSRQVPESTYTKTVKLPVFSGRKYLIGVFALYVTDQGLITLRLTYKPTAAEPAEPPANDAVENRIPLVGANVTVTGSNVGATTDFTDPSSTTMPLGRAWGTVWWGWTAPATGPYWVSTRGSDFDTRLIVTSGMQPGQLTAIQISDDEDTTTSTSRVILEAVQDREYPIMVDGYGGHVGNIVLSIEPAQGAAPPPNDDFANRQPLSGSLVSVRAANYDATFEPGEPSNSGSIFVENGHTVWYSWLAPQDGRVNAHPYGSRRGALMSLTIWEGDSLEDLTWITSGSRLPTEWQAVAGHTYQLQVNGSLDTAFTVILDASLEEELPRLRLTKTGQPSGTGLELSSLAYRRLELLRSSVLTSWEVLAEVWLQGTTNLVAEPAGSEPGSFFRAVAY
jgi:hypothetical protein